MVSKEVFNIRGMGLFILRYLPLPVMEGIFDYDDGILGGLA